jgi:small subunit ribosomal protein S4
MSRYTDAKCKLCRREGTKLFLKGNRCLTGKCGVTKREHAPGAHPWRRSRPTEYARRLREKQKLKRIYGIYEKPFRRAFQAAERQKGNTGENLLLLLERRLDSVVLNAGMAHSRAHARQMIVHGHLRLNGHRVRAPGQLVRVGDVIQPAERASAMRMIADTLNSTQSRTVPSWIERQMDPPAARVVQLPAPSDVPYEINLAFIVEFASR